VWYFYIKTKINKFCLNKLSIDFFSASMLPMSIKKTSTVCLIVISLVSLMLPKDYIPGPSFAKFVNEITKFSAERERNSIMYFQVMFVKIRFAEIPILTVTKI